MIYLIAQAFKLDGVKPTFKFIGKFLKLVSQPFIWLFRDLFNKPTGSRWATFFERFNLLNASNKGFVLDGDKKRLSTKDSYTNILLSSAIGAGKTTVAIIPNLFTLAKTTDSSLVVMDLKRSEHHSMGELYRLTSGFMARQGFNIRAFNLMNPLQSLSYNPLDQISIEPFQAFNDVMSLSNSLIDIQSSGQNQRSGDPHWTDSAKRLCNMFLNALRSIAEQDPQYRQFCTLPNLRYLFNQCSLFRDPRQGQINHLDEFMLRAGLSNPNLTQDYMRTLASNPRSADGEISSAISALATLSNPAIANLMGSNTFKFSELRDRKTILYCMVPSIDLARGNYKFLVKTFFSQLTNFLLTSVGQQRSVFMLMDELGSFPIDGFASFMSTAREHRVGVMGILQSVAQLNSLFGQDQANTIRDAMLTTCCFGGTSGVTAEYMSKKIGKTRYATKNEANRFTNHLEDPVITASEITSTDKKILFCSNDDHYPTKFKVTPYYKHPQFKKYAKIPPVPIPELTPVTAPILDLEAFSRQNGQPFEPEAFHPDPDSLVTDHE